MIILQQNEKLMLQNIRKHDNIYFVDEMFPVCVMVAQLTLDQFVEVRVLDREPNDYNACKVLCFASFFILFLIFLVMHSLNTLTKHCFKYNII